MIKISRKIDTVPLILKRDRNTFRLGGLMKAMRIFITSTVFLLTGILYAQGLDQRCTQMGESACVDWDRGV
ncbi:MAG: hypothetical protein MK438_04460, partial [SAR324 cluster bacterium]|nr:hypothetical protein [SAR324 cluster bacterium]